MYNILNCVHDNIVHIVWWDISRGPSVAVFMDDCRTVIITFMK